MTVVRCTQRCAQSAALIMAAATVLSSLGVARAEEDANTTDTEGKVATVDPADKQRAMLACKHAIWKKWSSGLEDVGVLINETMDASRPNGTDSEATLNYTQAARLLAERQLASCSTEVTAADLEADKGGGLSDAAVERLLGGAAAGFNLTEQDRDLLDQAIKGEIVNSEAPAILGVQVHSIPVWLQICYMLGVIAAVSYVVLLVVRSLTSRDKGKAEKAKKEKEGKKKS